MLAGLGQNCDRSHVHDAGWPGSKRPSPKSPFSALPFEHEFVLMQACMIIMSHRQETPSSAAKPKNVALALDVVKANAINLCLMLLEPVSLLHDAAKASAKTISSMLHPPLHHSQLAPSALH